MRPFIVGSAIMSIFAQAAAVLRSFHEQEIIAQFNGFTTCAPPSSSKPTRYRRNDPRLARPAAPLPPPRLPLYWFRWNRYNLTNAQGVRRRAGYAVPLPFGLFHFPQDWWK